MPAYSFMHMYNTQRAVINITVFALPIYFPSHKSQLFITKSQKL